MAHAPDGSLLVRGAAAGADGLFRIRDGVGGARPSATLVAGTGRIPAVEGDESKVPAAVSLEQAGTTVPVEWTLSRANATVDLVLTHTATGMTRTEHLSQPVDGSRFAFVRDGVLEGVLEGVSAPNGAYSWQVTATPADGVGDPATVSGGLRVPRRANPHDFNDNGSTDVLARDASGVLWLYRGDGAGDFATRVRVGTGWQISDRMTGAGDLTGDGRSDLIAHGANGTYVCRSTGSATAPSARRTTTLYAGEGTGFDTVS